MRVHLIRFRCFQDQTFYFPSQQFNLLKSPSGTGKSTLLDAIRWCFYGKSTDVYPLNTPGSAANVTCVTVTLEECGGIILCRSKPPEQLTISIGGTPENGVRGENARILKGQSAEAYVTDLFGSSQIWSMTSYLPQDEKSLLMTASNREKLELLQELTFGPQQEQSSGLNFDVPEKYLDQIETALAVVRTEVSTGTGQFNAMYTNYTTQAAEAQWTTNYWATTVTRNDLQALDREIAAVTADLTRFQQELLSTKQVLGQTTALETSRVSTSLQLQKLIDQLEALKSDGESINCTELETQITRYRAHERYEQIRVTEPQGSCREVLLNLLPEELRGRINTMYTVRVEYVRCETLCQQENIEYAPEKVNILIHTAESYLHQQMELRSRVEDQHRLSARHQEIDRALQMANNNYSGVHQRYLDSTIWWSQNYSRISGSRSRTSPEGFSCRGVVPSDDKVPTPSHEQIAKLRHEIQTRTGESLKCPQCQTSLEFKQGRLHPCTMEPLDPKEAKDINNRLTMIVESLNQLPSLEQRVKDLELQKVGLPIVDVAISSLQVLTPEALNAIRSKILQLQSITYPHHHTAHLTSEIGQWSLQNIEKYIAELQIGIEKQKWLNELKIQEQRLQQLGVTEIYTPNQPTPHGGYRELITRLQSRIMLLSNLEGQIKSQKSTLAQYEKDLDQLPICRSVETIEAQIAELNASKDQLQTRSRAGQLLCTLGELGGQIETQRQLLSRLYIQQQAQERLKVFIGEVTNHALQELADRISMTTNQIVGELFEDPIYIELKLFRELKSKDKTKSQFNIEVRYKGCTYDNLRRLSGGESNRVSLALTLSLARVSNSPVLFLDECMNNMNGSIRELCIKVIRRYSSHKTIINICHDIVEGFHDNVITI